MKYSIHPFAAKNFSHISDRGLRTSAAEDRLVELFFRDEKMGIFVEVGANDPIRASQTWHLEQLGWSGVLVEPISQLCDCLREQRPRSQVIQAACGPPGHQETACLYVATALSRSTVTDSFAFVPNKVKRTETVRMFKLDEILEQTGITRPDYVSIDVEGYQYEVLSGFSLSRYQPRLLVVEDHLLDLKTHRLIEQQGYRLVKRVVRNNWYIPKNQEFHLTCRMETFQLWRKVYLHTPFRKIRYALRAIIRSWRNRRKIADTGNG